MSQCEAVRREPEAWSWAFPLAFPFASALTLKCSQSFPFDFAPTFPFAFPFDLFLCSDLKMCSQALQAFIICLEMLVFSVTLII